MKLSVSCGLFLHWEVNLFVYLFSLISLIFFCPGFLQVLTVDTVVGLSEFIPEDLEVMLSSK